MDKIKKNSKLKEPVRLRAKKLANGNLSLYLDTYTKGKRSYEFLKLYLIPERNADDKAVNSTVLRAANAIKASRILTLINGKANIKAISPQIMLSDWIEKIIRKKAGGHSPSGCHLMRRLMRHLNIHRPDILLSDIDRGFCVDFADYLRSARALNSDKTLSSGTQYELLNALSAVLNEAVRAELIDKNPTNLLNTSERIKKPESTREYLTPEEVKIMMSVSNDNIKEGDDVAAFLFCCFCGLRYSDAVALKWSDIRERDGEKEILITMIKTQRYVVVPLSRQASSLLPPRGLPEKSVFAFPSYGVTLRKLKKLAATTGIRKKITFHVSRHTFATMMLTAGADLYTISKLVGHADIRTTQIYSKVVDQKKRQAVNLLDRLF